MWYPMIMNWYWKPVTRKCHHKLVSLAKTCFEENCSFNIYKEINMYKRHVHVQKKNTYKISEKLYKSMFLMNIQASLCDIFSQKLNDINNHWKRI